MKSFLFIILLFLISCTENKLEPVKTKLEGKELPDQLILNNEIKFTEAGKLKAIVFSDTLKKFNKKNETILKNVHIDFYNIDGEKNSMLDSDKGSVNNVTKDMIALGNVIARNTEGVILTTDELKWINKSKKITTDKYVKIITKQDTTEGYGFESNQELTEYKIFNPTYYSTTKSVAK